MRKNWTLRAGVLMLALTLITSCFVGGTFAKYTTAGEGTDLARVAKFGVEVTSTGNMFEKIYAADDESYKLAAETVVSTEDVVAPGTKGEMVGFTITGTPEVAVRITYEATTVDFGDNWVDADGNYYCPIEVTIGNATLKGNNYQSIDVFENEIKRLVAECKRDLAAGTDLSTLDTTETLDISWNWPFYVSDENDIKDTYLGDQAAYDNAATIKIAVEATVTQID